LSCLPISCDYYLVDSENKNKFEIEKEFDSLTSTLNSNNFTGSYPNLSNALFIIVEIIHSNLTTEVQFQLENYMLFTSIGVAPNQHNIYLYIVIFFIISFDILSLLLFCINSMLTIHFSRSNRNSYENVGNDSVELPKDQYELTYLFSLGNQGIILFLSFYTIMLLFIQILNFENSWILVFCVFSNILMSIGWIGFYSFHLIEVYRSSCTKMMSNVMLTSEVKDQIELFKKETPEVILEMKCCIESNCYEKFQEKLTFNYVEDVSDDFEVASSPYVHIEIKIAITPGDEKTRLFIQRKTESMVNTNKKNSLSYTFTEKIHYKNFKENMLMVEKKSIFLGFYQYIAASLLFFNSLSFLGPF
jgi:hypothetical protein